jgi:uncharacterized protein HemY
LVAAGGMNAAIEQHDLNLAGIWLNRATSEMQQEPQLMLEKERYLSFKGDYEQSAEVGRETIKVLPQDRDAVVYLGYDLLRLEEYNQLLDLISQFITAFPHEPDLPLLAGYVHPKMVRPTSAWLMPTWICIGRRQRCGNPSWQNSRWVTSKFCI